MKQFQKRYTNCRPIFGLAPLKAILLVVLSIYSQITCAQPTYTIPVVFHILHQGGPENISDAQVLDALNILNQDFQKLNPDIVNVVPSYTAIAADVQFKFVLAQKDPNGNCTNGIIRHFTTRTVWNASDPTYYAYTWPRANYLNFYIVKTMTTGSGAYTFFPGTTAPASDVIVALNTCCGSIGTSNPGNSRWLTQKVGHWFNLQHTWGLSNTIPTACGDDGVADTPPTKGFLTCATQSANVCNPLVDENVQNFMEGSPCQIMFTQGQKARMHTCINSTVSARNNLSTAANLSLTGVTSSTTNCLPLLEIAALPNATVCTGTPLSIVSFTSNASVTSYSWSANNGAVVSNATLAATSVVLNGAGNSTVICVASNSNGAVTASLVVQGVNQAANVTGVNSESFENALLPPNWLVLNPNTPLALWSQISGYGSHGNQSMMVNGENAPGGSVEILQSPSYNFAANKGNQFTFKYAYARQSSGHNDIFKVQASKDCGSTWKDIYTPSAAQLAQGSGEILSTLFVPSPWEWKSYALHQHPNFAGFLNETNVMIRFYFKEDTLGQGNRFYLDQVNFEVPTGVNELSRQLQLSVYPNPASPETRISFVLGEEKTMNYSVHNLQGSTLLRSAPIKLLPGPYALPIKNIETLESGIYFLNLKLEGTTFVQKLVVE